ncbi:hypothetical protein K1T71_010323 [Dendrolimus kikuchii]|uniref:Uncharacterized protein n=1 Tax=Dendrolimus kikuchii TaxID=765133 RepID=A0ACC1CSG9_9NEOP|nr:hypothetical protein K1T71_010323 [Dendrolimus kikuchii]
MQYFALNVSSVRRTRAFRISLERALRGRQLRACRFMHRHFAVHLIERFRVGCTCIMEIEHFDTDLFIDEIQKRKASSYMGHAKSRL